MQEGTASSGAGRNPPGPAVAAARATQPHGCGGLVTYFGAKAMPTFRYAPSPYLVAPSRGEMGSPARSLFTLRHGDTDEDKTGDRTGP